MNKSRLHHLPWSTTKANRNPISMKKNSLILQNMSGVKMMPQCTCCNILWPSLHCQKGPSILSILHAQKLASEGRVQPGYIKRPSISSALGLPKPAMFNAESHCGNLQLWEMHWTLVDSCWLQFTCRPMFMLIPNKSWILCKHLQALDPVEVANNSTLGALFKQIQIHLSLFLLP